MERSGNFYKAIRLGYILISILIGCMAYNSLYEWQEIEALELGNKKIDELRKEINNINIQMIKFSLLGETCQVINATFWYRINSCISNIFSERKERQIPLFSAEWIMLLSLFLLSVQRNKSCR